MKVNMKKNIPLIIAAILFSYFNSTASNLCLPYYSQLHSNNKLELKELSNLLVEIKHIDNKYQNARSLASKYKQQLFDKYLEAIFKHSEYLDKMKINESLYDESFLIQYSKILEMFSLEISPFNFQYLQLIDHAFNEIFEFVLNKKNIKYSITTFQNDFGVSRSEIEILGSQENDLSRFVKKIADNFELRTVFNLYKLNGFTSAVDPENSVYYINLKSILNFKSNEVVAHEMYHAASAAKRNSGKILLEDGWLFDFTKASGPYQNFALEELKAYDISARVTASKLLSNNQPEQLQRLKDIKEISLKLSKRSQKILTLLSKKLQTGEAKVGTNYYNGKLKISFENYSIHLANISPESTTKEDLRKLLLEKLSFTQSKIKIYTQLSKDLEEYEKTKDFHFLNAVINSFRNKSALLPVSNSSEESN